MDEQITDPIQSLTDKLSGWLNTLIVNLPNIFLALFLFIASYFISQKLSQWSIHLLSKKVKQRSIQVLIGNVISILVIALGLFLALSIMNLDKALTSILAGAGVAGLAVGLALQGAISNTFSGIFLAVKDIMNVGDFIETNGYIGTVESIDLRYVKLKEPDNNIVIIPNKLVVDNPFKNYGLTSEIRASINCGVAYDSDLKQVKELAINAIAKRFPHDEKVIEFHYTEFGSSSINFQMRFWVEATAKLTILEVKSEAIMAIKESFDKYGIEIPYPITTILAAHSES